MRETMLSLVSAAFCTGGSSGGLHCQSGVLVCRAPSPAQASSAVVEPLRESFRVDLNTAGIDAMTTLPGLGRRRREPFWNIVLPMAGSRAR